ncbi:LacI family DNA-binding transcriptional regulator [Staphylococcus americanisciuri]|uniref:LacI family DNA-binding transcriptional regulator n=1 Tax=Staphylococcus americanisciuri TaxID=2973940 RepID=A0ABT2F3C7_9STAP|nr:LacI family DNA-binding transcriptional regulator [Staphylococcus americanisciuri]MCS4486963.1 LacI family DNA-binding transcriptional regulator [Staphylococcus americanisciuri]
MNIQDIARLAGVSKSTVSRYLNNGSVSPKTQCKIQKIIETHGYAPNQFAQSLRAQQTKLIGVIIPRMYSYAVASTVHGIKKACEIQGYQMLLTLTERARNQELEALRSFQRSKVDGVLFMATEITDAHMAVIESMSMPVILIGQTHAQLSAIYHDDEAAGRLMAERIIAAGYERVRYAGVSDIDKAVGHLRYQGLYDTLNSAGVAIETYQAAFDYDEALRQVQKQLTIEVNTAYVGATDTIALALYRVIMSEPQTFTPFIGGFGGDPVTDIVHPKIHTIYYQYERAGQMAVQALFRQLTNNQEVTTQKLEVLSSPNVILFDKDGTVTI